MPSGRAEPRSTLLIGHEAAVLARGLKPPAAVLLPELVPHATSLRTGHPGLDPGDGGLGARQDRGMVGERYAKRTGSRALTRRPIAKAAALSRPALERNVLAREAWFLALKMIEYFHQLSRASRLVED